MQEALKYDTPKHREDDTLKPRKDGWYRDTSLENKDDDVVVLSLRGKGQNAKETLLDLRGLTVLKIGEQLGTLFVANGPNNINIADITATEGPNGTILIMRGRKKPMKSDAPSAVKWIFEPREKSPDNLYPMITLRNLLRNPPPPAVQEVPKAHLKSEGWMHGMEIIGGTSIKA